MPLDDLHTGDLYLPNDPELWAEQVRCMDKLDEFNLTRVDQMDEREQMMRDMFAEVGPNCYIEPPLNANFGGRFLHLGEGVYFNSNVTLVDDTHIWIGSHTLIGPNCVLAVAVHPVHPGLRAKGYQYNKPIHIGENCWFGAGVLVMPGVTIGDNTIIGAGSVVTRDVPCDVIAVGNPCRVLREVTEEDMTTFDGGRPIPDELLGD